MSFLNNLISSFRQLAMSSIEEPIWESPSVEDVLAVKDILSQAYDLEMPLELIDSIIDYAEYWPHTSVNTSTYSPQQLKNLTARGGTDGRNEDIFVLRSLPIGILPEQIDSDTHLGLTDGFAANPPNPVSFPEASEATNSATEDLLQKWSSTSSIRGKPCRKIVFTIHSNDQGWGGNHRDKGTFNGSYTWFDVGLERLEACDSSSPESTDLQRIPVTTPNSSQDTFCHLRTIKPSINDLGKFDHPFLPPPIHIIRNRTATKDVQKHVITWSYDDDTSPDDPAAEELNSEGRGKESGNGEFVRDLKVGDVITVWSRARFGGWTNLLEYCQIDVYWAV